MEVGRRYHFPSISFIETYENWFVEKSTGRIHATFAWNHVLCKIEGSEARDVSETARAQAKKCTMSGAIQSGS
jgi:hypothetical protein